MSRRFAVLLIPLVSASLLIIAVHYALAREQTDWGGTLGGDTTLGPDGNPHIVTGDLIVPDGITLTIAPGAELYFAPGASLIVYGRLLAEGTPTQTILFTRRDAGTYWGAIALLYTQADNRIAHATIEYTDRKEGDIPRSYGVTAYSARVILADSVLRYTRGRDGAGVVADWDSTLYLLRNEIHDVGGDAVHPTGGTAVIQGNHIYNARWGDYYYEGIEVSKMPSHSPAILTDNHIHDVSDDCLDVNNSWIVVARNRLHHCADKGISIGSGSKYSTQPSSATLVNNLVYATQEGIAVKDSAQAWLIHNTVVSNGTGLALYEAWDHPGLGGGQATVVNTILWGNDRAVYLDALSALTVTFSDVAGGWPGEGNLDADPLFQGTTDFRLRSGSPAINAGQDQGIAQDLDGQPRPVGRAPDLGAYERQSLLQLRAWPGDQRIYLAWQPALEDPALKSFAISYTRSAEGSATFSPTLVTDLPTTTRAYTLSGLTNYVWYSVSVEGRDAADGLLMRSDVVSVMPTDRYLYLPLTLRYAP